MTIHWTRMIAAAAIVWAAAPAAAETLELTSPDGKITVTVKDDGGQATYAVSYQGKQVIAPSKLGMLFAEHHGFERGLAIAGSARASQDTTWEQPWGERSGARSAQRAGRHLQARRWPRPADDRALPRLRYRHWLPLRIA
jgi:alpha-glucosidase